MALEGKLHLPRQLSSLFRTLTVGSGITPDLLDPGQMPQALAGCFRHTSEITAGGEFHPALRIVYAKQYQQYQVSSARQNFLFPYNNTEQAVVWNRLKSTGISAKVNTLESHRAND